MLVHPLSAEDIEKKILSPIVKQYCDSIALLKNNIYMNSTDEIGVDPQYYQLVSPSMYYSEHVRDFFALDSTKGNIGSNSANGILNGLFLNVYASTPSLLTNHEEELGKESIIFNDNTNKASTDKVLEEVFSANDDIINDMANAVDDVEIEITKPNFWTKSSNFSSQFTQNYFSDNWYKGGNNNATMLTSIIMKANYNDQKKITWENTLEMRLGFITTTDDSCHNFLTNNDRLRLWSKLGVKASKEWAYTTTFEATTQFMPSYRSNDRRTYSDFLAPLDVFLSFGMDFKPKFNNSNTLSVALLPLSYKLRYVGDKDEVIHAATNMIERNTKEDFGSKMELQSSVNIVKNLTWTCRFVAFTSYEYVESELENRLHFKLTKYISSELYTIWRFDDNRPRELFDENLGYFQFREYLTFGLTYDF
jgi:hypothetical protein